MSTAKKEINLGYLIILTAVNYSLSLEKKKDIFASQSARNAAFLSLKLQDAEQILIVGRLDWY